MRPWFTYFRNEHVLDLTTPTKKLILMYVGLVARIADIGDVAHLLQHVNLFEARFTFMNTSQAHMLATIKEGK